MNRCDPRIPPEVIIIEGKDLRNCVNSHPRREVGIMDLLAGDIALVRKTQPFRKDRGSLREQAETTSEAGDLRFGYLW